MNTPASPELSSSRSDRSPSPGRAKAPRVAIVGATGAVGEEFLRVLHQRGFPMSELKLLASARSAGKRLRFGNQALTCETLTSDSFEGVDLALFSAGGSISKTLAPVAVEAGAVVIDNSSAFRMTPGVPLVIPEVNPHAVADAGIGLGPSDQPGIIANPNCSTIIMLVAVNPLHQAVPVRRMVVSTYQAASGAGAAAMRELEQQTREALDPANDGKAVTRDIFPFQYAFNLFSHNSPMQSNGYNQEELKMVHETHKILGQPAEGQTGDRMAITATCIRVPVMRAHAESINLTFDGTMTPERACELLAAAPGVSLIDDREANRFPTPLDATHQDDCYVGRIRRDLSQPEGVGLDLFVCGDQVRKGAALNAVQIAELLVG
ncbi:MAG: aspartate-semialdehyde dehydrogenase [Planctomycetota bacterium]